MAVYEPQEDSKLLEKHVKALAKGICLDVGTGSGIQAQAAAKTAEFVIAVDINQEALTYCNEHVRSNKILFMHSDLFSAFAEKEIVIKKGLFKGIRPKINPNKFDTIIFNAPYLPDDPKDPDLALDGGKEGYEIIERFLEQAQEHLAEKGNILLIFSSQTGKDQVDELIEKNHFSFEELEKIHIFFEDIYCYRIYSDRVYLAKGKRGIVYKKQLDNQNVAVKIPSPQSSAPAKLDIEADFLPKLNKEGIGPTFISYQNEELTMEFIDGELFELYLTHCTQEQALAIISNLLNQMHTLDKLGINKEEMHHPFKHIIIRDDKPVLIDFERCRYTENSHNLTQFLQYLSNDKLKHLLDPLDIHFDKEKIIALAAAYKQSRDFSGISQFFNDHIQQRN